MFADGANQASNDVQIKSFNISVRRWFASPFISTATYSPSSMATSTRPAMRLLSQRLLQLQRHQQAPITRLLANQIRYSSNGRYSSPSKRSLAAPTADSSFVPNATQPDVVKNDAVADITDAAAKHKEQARRWARMKVASIGLAATFIGLCITLYSIDLKELSKPRNKISLDASAEANARFQGKDVHVIGIGEGKRIVAEDQAGAIDLVETGTSSVPHFPKVMYLPSASDSDVSDVNALNAPNVADNAGNRANLEEYTLVGLGIRSVSFLAIQVYVIGLYAKTTDITGLQARLIHHVNPTASTLIPSEKEDLKTALTDAEASREIWNELLSSSEIKTAWRIVPTRNTDFMHLRDGFITGINKRTAEAKKRNGNVPSEYDREDFGQSIRSFMSIFKGGKAPKGSIMILSRNSAGELDVYFTPKVGSDGKEKETELLGSISDARISKLIWLNYLAGEKVSSEAVRQGVADGLVAFASRPVGSVETMVA